jgi:cytochrome oxidase Cu insertion factor (SCO1/SenC/PrrC family)
MTQSVSPASRRTLLWLALLFALPVIVSYGLYYSGWRPASTGNYGELVQPPQPLEDATLSTLDGQVMRVRAWRGKWTLLTFSPSLCPSPCERNLYKMRQVIAAQGEDANRVQSVLIVTDQEALARLRNILRDYPRTQVLIGPSGAVASLARQFELPAGGPPSNLHRVYLVDPLGNLMMSYPANADPNGMRKDLARLLKVSRVG